jgi:hypothetical protein
VLARDASGRLYVESHSLPSPTDSGKPANTLYVIADPVAKRMLRWNTSYSECGDQHASQYAHSRYRHRAPA